MSTETTKNKSATKTTTAAKPAKRKTTAAKTKKAVSAKATPRKKVARKTTAAKSKTIKVAQPQTINYQTRYQMIQEAAYHIAERQDFRPDNELAHWLEAETQIDRWIASEKIHLTN